MARTLNMAFLATILVASALLQSISAQTTHVVGDALGWTIPPGGAAAYSTWAATKTFAVGDILVFNFTTGAHDVAQVTQANYDACSTSNPIMSQSTGPARITLNAGGAHYFVCNFNGHCSAGQKLAINVSVTTSTAPSPSPATTPSPRTSPSPTPVLAPSPAPASSPSTTPASTPSPTPVSTPSSTPSEAPAPGPSRSSVTYTVGDSLGWAVPSNGAAAYQTWAAGKNFSAGDVLVFNFASGAHDVAEVTQTNYDSCNTASTISLSRSSPTSITLTSGEHYFICTFTGHCSAGQKLAINVTGTATASPPVSSTPPASDVSPPPPGNSASSLGLAGLFTFLATLVALLF